MECRPLESQRFEIRIPPSVDSMYRNVPKVGRVKTKKYLEWSNATGWEFVRQKARAMTPPVSLTLMIFGGKGFPITSDVSNRHKAAEDAVVAAKIVPDDNVQYVWETVSRYVPPQGKKDLARAVLVVQEIDAKEWAAGTAERKGETPHE